MISKYIPTRLLIKYCLLQKVPMSVSIANSPSLPYMVPPSMLDHLAISAIINYNISPTSSNVNSLPPLVSTKDNIDYSKFCTSSFGEVVYTTENNGL